MALLRNTLIFGIGLLLTVEFIQPAPAFAATQDSPEKVKVELVQPYLVPEGLPWNQTALRAANKIIGTQKSILNKTMTKLKLLGASIIEVIDEPTESEGETFQHARAYGADFVAWHLAGKGSRGLVKGQPVNFPSDTGDLANYLVRIKATPCSLREFSVLDFSTWFQPRKCEIEIPSASKYLRASLATALHKSTSEFGSHELAQLKYAMQTNTHLQIRDGYLICPELRSFFSGETRIRLRKQAPIGGYLIAVDLHTRTARYKFLGPNFSALAENAHQEPGEDFVRFF
jgi:hypothetical protein